MNLHETIYRLRTSQGMSQLELAEALEVSRQSISKWETGAAVPELDKLIKLSEVFGVTLDELVQGAPSQEKEQQAFEAVMPQPTAAASQPRRMETHRIISLALLCTFLLLTVLLLCFGGVRSALSLGLLPMAVCAIFLALPRRHLLWGFWALWLLVALVLRVLTGGWFLSAGAGNIVFLLGSIGLTVSLIFLVVATVRRFKTK